MNPGLTPMLSPFYLVQSSFQKAREAALGSYTRVSKEFTETGRDPWLRGDSALGLPVY